MFFRMLYDRKLAQAAYLIGCQATGEALIIDPERDVDRYINEAEQEKLKITAIAETHIHADFLSGARELAERTGARLYLSDEGDADWKYTWMDKKQGGGSYDHKLLKDGDTFKVGNIEIQALHTPGHTPEHMMFMITDSGSGATEPMGIASGDFIFVGDVGRPDLLETAAGKAGAKEKSAQVLYQSLQRFQTLPDYLQLWPGHGAGSACGKALGAVPQSTVGYEKRFNAAISAAKDETRFVHSILYGQPEPPLYFARMKRENRDGPRLLGNMPDPKPVTVTELRKTLKQEIALLDTRAFSDYTAGHIKGALHTPLNSVFPTVAGSYVESGIPIYLIIAADKVNEAVTDLIRIGLDDIAGYIIPETLAQYASAGGEMQSVESIDIKELMSKRPGNNALVLDVRRFDEYEAGHLPNTWNIAHTRLLAHLDELPRQKSILVHCRTSARSAYATGLLASRGYNVTHLAGGFVDWQAAGGEIIKDKAVST